MSECVRNTIISELKGNATSYIINKDKTEIFVPARKFGKDSAYRIAESMVNKANRIFNSKLFGSSVSLNTTYTDGTAVNIQPTKKLIESYEVKGNSISINKLIYNNRLDFFNGDVALFEQEQQDLNNNNNTLYQNTNTEGIIASEKTIRDVAARMADRIGLNVKFEADKSKDYKGKLEGNTAVVNLANATLDTPIHEILGHPIIRAIKNVEIDVKKYNKAVLIETSFGWGILGGYSQIYNEFLTKSEAEEFLKSKQSNTNLYNNLLKELETGTGKEVLDRIKRDYNVKEFSITDMPFGKPYEYKNKTFDTYNEALKYKNDNKELYTLEEQQEEALVELLGLMTAKKLDNVKDGKLISLLKRLLESISEFMRGLLKSKEIDISKLPDNMTLGNISDLLAYSNSKLILPGYEVKYTTPDNNNFQTYSEANNHISQLAKNVKDIDLNNINLGNIETVEEKFKKLKQTGEPLYSAKYSDGYYSRIVYKKDNWVDARGFNNKSSWVEERGSDLNKADVEYPMSDYNALNYFKTNFKKKEDSFKDDVINKISQFVEKNKEYEQSKDIIDEWKKVNNIQYNPEEIYSRGQEFVSIVGAYSDFDVNLMMQNLLHHIEDNQKAGGQFAISAITKPIDKKIGHLEGGGGKIRFKIYPKSENILWASNTDVYSGSVWDASTKVNKDKKSELLGVSYTKYPSLRSINTVQPNLASVVDDLAHHHNELGITLTGNNFRLEYDEDIPYTTKKIINGVNSILDQKYGKLVKPEIKTEIKKSNILPTLDYKFASVTTILNTLDSFYPEIIEDIQKRNINIYTKNDYLDKYLIEIREFLNEEVQNNNLKLKGIQPTQTNKTLKESINSIKNKVEKYDKDSIKSKVLIELIANIKNSNLSIDDFFVKQDEVNNNFYIKLKSNNQTIGYNYDTKESGLNKIKEAFDTINNEKEYNNQALINTKIAALKEVAKKYPRSLIRSEVVIKRVDPFNFGPEDGGVSSMFLETELPFQKVPSPNDNNTPIKEGVSDIFEQSPELANVVYESLGFQNTLDFIFDKRTNTLINTVAKNKDICLFTQYQVIEYLNKRNISNMPFILFKVQSPLTSNKIAHSLTILKINNKVYFYDMPQNEFIKVTGNNIKENDIDLVEGIYKKDYKPYLIEVTKENIINKYGVSEKDLQLNLQLIDSASKRLKNNNIILNQITPQQKQQAQQQYSNYLDSIFPVDKQIPGIFLNQNRFGKIDKLYLETDNEYNNIVRTEPELHSFIFFTPLENEQTFYGENKNYAIFRESDEKNSVDILRSDTLAPAYPNDLFKEKDVLIVQAKALVEKKFGYHDSYYRVESGKYNIKAVKNNELKINFIATNSNNNFHILGNENDIQGFKEFINNTNDNVSESEPQKLAYIDEENTVNELDIDNNDVSLIPEDNDKISDKLQRLMDSGDIITFCG